MMLFDIHNRYEPIVRERLEQYRRAPSEATATSVINVFRAVLTGPFLLMGRYGPLISSYRSAICTLFEKQTLPWSTMDTHAIPAGQERDIQLLQEEIFKSPRETIPNDGIFGALNVDNLQHDYLAGDEPRSDTH